MSNYLVAVTNNFVSPWLNKSVLTDDYTADVTSRILKT